MTTDLIPDSAGRADQGQGKQQERTHAEGPRRHQLPSKEEILSSLAQMPGLIVIGLLKPGAANSIRAIYSELLRSLSGGADNRHLQVGDDLLAAIREHPEMLKLMSPLLTDKQIELLMATTKDDEDGQA